MKHSIHIDHELKLIRYKHSGLINAEDIEAAWGDFMSIKEFTELQYNLFSDYRNGKFQIPINALSEIIEYMRVLEKVVRGKKQALIVDEPYSVAVSILFKSEVYKELGFNVQVFSTETAALHWLSH